MPSGTHEVSVNSPINTIWDFVSDMNNWAPLVPGYVEHNKRNEKQSTWKFKGDVGIIQKKVSMQIDITEWKEPTLVTFDLKGLSENFTGKGYFKAEAISQNQTKMTGNITITAAGMTGPMINSVLKSFVPKTATDLTNNIAKKVTKLTPVFK
ncbi:CoxG family protein [Radiobacillus sp. PE A8.2]|uniref:CoxG family protein n=1 Tax=Radiobacillus sp. PE A8.2 TaxID=3380349 RepID=UPI00388E61DE